MNDAATKGKVSGKICHFQNTHSINTDKKTAKKLHKKALKFLPENVIAHKTALKLKSPICNES